LRRHDRDDVGRGARAAWCDGIEQWCDEAGLGALVVMEIVGLAEVLAERGPVVEVLAAQRTPAVVECGHGGRELRGSEVGGHEATVRCRRVTAVDGLLRALRSTVGERHVLIGSDSVGGYVTDWTGRYVGSTPAVVRPGSVDEVADVIRQCRAHQVALVPQGGNTGLVGGGVPLEGEIVLSTRRLDALGDVDAVGMQLEARAGVTLAAVHAAAERAGLAFGVDLAARDSATIGGMVATNAGGTHVVRHGHMRANLLGIEAVLGDGTVVRHLAGLRKDNTGYDLAGLLCGSEGTLGVITAATLRLVARPASLAVALVGFGSVEAAVVAATELQRRLPSVQALELVLAGGTALVAERLGVALPEAARAPAVVLVECGADDDPTPALAEVVDTLAGQVSEPAVAVDQRDQARLWRIREAHPEAAATLGVVHKVDVTVPLRRLAELVGLVPAVVEAVAPGATCLVYGHLGDGNVHVNVIGPDAADERADDAVFELVLSLGGSISAEHGIGTAKRRWLTRARSAGDIAAFRAIKAALDPDGILNPNAVLPPA
jgi:FAD/FMN-containing dehydrogenase